MRAVAGAEPAAEVTLLSERNAAEVVQTPTMTRMFSLPLAARFSSVAGAEASEMFALRAIGSFSSSSLTAFASSISCCVRLRIATGLPRQRTEIDWPGSSAAMSTSMEARARVDASGFIWSMNGQATAAMPTAPKAPVVSIRKSRRVGSAGEAE